MAKIGNASSIMKELSNLLKFANPILNTVLGFKAWKPQAAGYVCGYGH